MDHDSIGCECFEIIPDENVPPEMPEMTIVQPDRKFDRDHEMSVASVFISSTPYTQSSSAPAPIKKQKLQLSSIATVKNPNRKPYSYKDRKYENAQERREIKKKLFMDLGIVRTNCGIDNEKKNREEAIKRKVTETIVTTYCELCEQNFSSSKMQLLHRMKNVSLVLTFANRFEMRPVQARCENFISLNASTLSRDKTKLFQVTCAMSQCDPNSSTMSVLVDKLAGIKEDELSRLHFAEMPGDVVAEVYAQKLQRTKDKKSQRYAAAGDDAAPVGCCFTSTRRFFHQAEIRNRRFAPHRNAKIGGCLEFTPWKSQSIC
ncbi:hypothetical protein CAEBREN_15928 [Caenorhabditis brenneri]|uniref:Uncharacterized protein n=1 Tax=Caenorhabditis brenneri TaxID=135651 RepID=G0MGL2_CAEBE|nr:hypothetical protein CAEBREN_15928 [Caenorhabditis brenneri]